MRMYNLTHNIILAVVLVLYSQNLAFADSKIHILTSQQWNIPREASSIIEMSAIRAAMHDLQSNKKGKMLIKYPGGDVGTLWAHELRSWLISLGLSEKFIELVPGSSNPNQIELVVIKPPY
ncbi:hypothetical protein MNBD_GAMMA21-3032 [hydrothermal vent metagenome]|uniref:Uncharacterized protein n=1 Tax=hydrothermal vent metagenome TaxID=652676 RepID=A0A3B1ALF5_9ZZZZ